MSQESSSSQPHISQKAAKRAQRAIEFVLRQLIRFAKMPAKEQMALYRKNLHEAFCTIPRPDGKGHYQCGLLARKKLNELTEIALETDSSLGRRVDRGRARDVTQEVFVRQILGNDREIDLEVAESFIEEVLGSLRKTLKVTEHFLPCVFFLHGGPDEFKIGPTTFTRRAKFFRDRKQQLRESITANIKDHIEQVEAAVARGFPQDKAFDAKESRRLVRRLHARAIKLYRSYPWIASVKIVNCDADRSKERAEQSIEIALHIVRIVLGAGLTKKIRLAHARGNATRTAHMYASESGYVQISLGSESMGPVGVENWHEILKHEARDLFVFGSALNMLVDPITPYHVHDRFIDAINWFGDAATDPVASSSLVKYVSAVERLLFGKFELGRKKAFANRINGVLKAFGCDENNAVYEMALKVYETRSALLHGDYSPDDARVQRLEFQAEELSRLCLLCSAQIYPMMLRAYDNPDAIILERDMHRISLEGADWLAIEAGYKINDDAVQKSLD